jgi:hypothetical protein
MEVTKAPPVPIDPSGGLASGGPGGPGGLGGRGGAAPVSAASPPLVTAGPGLSFPSPAALLWDAVNIQPLNVVGALQILLAEVRAELLPGDVPHMAGAEPMSTGVAFPGFASLSDASAAPQVLVDMILQALPQPGHESEPELFLSAVTRVEAAVQSALDKGIDAVVAWHDVPAAVVDAAKQTRALVMAAFKDDPPNPMWLRPEWLGLAPRMERFRRRRRGARHGLSDPDLLTPDRDDSPGETQEHGDRR